MAIDIKSTKINERYRAIIIMLAMFLRTASDRLFDIIDYSVGTERVPSDQPYTGPTYGKMANTTRQLIAGKIAHEKSYTGNTGWLYMTIAGLINRKTNTLEASVPDLIIETGMSRQSILTHTNLLEKMGLITVGRERCGAKSSEINIYSLIGEGAEVTLWNGSQKNIATPKQPSKILTTPVKNIDGKDSLQTNPKRQAAVAVNNKKSSLEKVELSPRQQAAVNALKDVKITGTIARELAILHDHEFQRLFATIKCAQASSSIRNPAGFVRAEMKNNEQGLSWDIVSNGWQTLDDFINKYLPKAPEDYAPPAKPEPAPIPPMYDKPAGPELPPLPEVDPQVKELWTIAYNQLELQFDRATFDTWLRGAQVIDREADGLFVIGVRNGYVRDMLQHRLYRNIRRVLSDVCGKSVELRFVIVHIPEEKEDGRMPLFKLLAQET